MRLRAVKVNSETVCRSLCEEGTYHVPDTLAGMIETDSKGDLSRGILSNLVSLAQANDELGTPYPRHEQHERSGVSGSLECPNLIDSQLMHQSCRVSQVYVSGPTKALSAYICFGSVALNNARVRTPQQNSRIGSHNDGRTRVMMICDGCLSSVMRLHVHVQCGSQSRRRHIRH